MSGLGGLWDQLVDAVCRPPRDVYSEEDLVGGRRAAFRLAAAPGAAPRRYYRQDVELRNAGGQRLLASHYRPCVVTSRDGRLPAVVYCHCNSGSRRDAEEVLYQLLPRGITVFALDFAGSGLSDGAFVTLGAREVDDLAAAVEYLRAEGSTSSVALWGRSMGAVTALLYAQRDPSVAGVVADSPFSRLSDLMLELGSDSQIRVPRPLLRVAVAMVKRSVRKRAGFAVEAVAPLDRVGECFVPVLFGHAAGDTFVAPHHSERLLAAYAGDKNLVTFAGDHNSPRPDFFYDSALIFLLSTLRVEELVGPQADVEAALAAGDGAVVAAPDLEPLEHASIYISGPGRQQAKTVAELQREREAEAAAEAAKQSPARRAMSPPWELPRRGHAPPSARRLAVAPSPTATTTSTETEGEGISVLPGSMSAGSDRTGEGEEEEGEYQDYREDAALAGPRRVAPTRSMRTLSLYTDEGEEGEEEEEEEEEEALQRALEASLLDQRGGGTAGDEPADAGAAAGPGGSAGVVEGEEAAQLAAAIAASLQEQPAAVADGGDDAPPALAAPRSEAQAAAQRHAQLEAGSARAASQQLQSALSAEALAAAAEEAMGAEPVEGEGRALPTGGAPAR